MKHVQRTPIHIDDSTPSEAKQPHRSKPRVAVLIASLMFATLAPIQAAGADLEGDVATAEHERDDAYAEVVRVQEELDAAVFTYQEVAFELEDLHWRVDRLTARLDESKVELDILDGEVRELVTARYMLGDTASVGMVMDAASIQDLATGRAISERATEATSALLDRQAALSRNFESNRSRLLEDVARVEELKAVAEESLNRVNELLDEAQHNLESTDQAYQQAVAKYEAEQERLRLEEERRKARKDAGTGGGRAVDGLVCPSSAPRSFMNDWGFPRSGGRTHKGTDIFAPYGAPVYATTSGVVRAKIGGLGGITIWLNGDDGNGYYYAHLSEWADGIETGVRVSQGELVGYVGDSGNAEGTSPHTHFQIHPGNGSPINPYPTLKSICG